MRLSSGQREFIADKLMYGANYALAGLVFGQLLTEQVNPVIMLLGAGIYTGAWISAIWLKKEKRHVKSKS